MMGPGEVFIAFFVIGLPILCPRPTSSGAGSSLREKRARDRGQPGRREGRAICRANAELEPRVRVLEQIVTDGGSQTAAQIEALRELPERPMIEARGTAETKQ